MNIVDKLEELMPWQVKDCTIFLNEEDYTFVKSCSLEDYPIKKAMGRIVYINNTQGVYIEKSKESYSYIEYNKLIIK